MAGNRNACGNGHPAFMVFMGSQQFTFDSFDNAIEALDRSGITREDGVARDILERRAAPLCAESVETWP